MYCWLLFWTVAASHFDIAFCCETKATRRRHAADLRLPGYCEPVLLPRSSCSNGMGMVMYSRFCLAVSQLSMFECNRCEFMVVRVREVKLNFHLFFVCRSPIIDDNIYDCLLESKDSIQSQDRKSVFCVVSDFNGPYSERLGSSRMYDTALCKVRVCCLNKQQMKTDEKSIIAHIQS